MENLRRQFLLEAVETLEILLKNLQSAKGFSDSLRRETFRTLHTIKGTAQTFGFAAASRLAHELENLISASKNPYNLLLEGVKLLIKSLTEKDFESTIKFVEKIRAAAPNATDNFYDSDAFLHELPNEIFSQLSNQEKKILRSITRDHKNLFCLEIGFEMANFADELINFRETLNHTGEIIATFPSAKFSSDGKIGFQILLASGANQLPPVEKFGAEIIFQTSPQNLSGAARRVLEQAAQHGKQLAETFAKQIEFEVYADEIDLPPAKLKLVFDVLLHLVRNAVDHAIENEGKITINFSTEKNGCRLTIADDGSGIDAEKIKARAVEKNLISDDAFLTEKETIDLIFLPEFSTKNAVTDISGRGIGLDAVKYLVEKAGGQISVESRKGKGAMFEFFLPRNETANKNSTE